MLEHASVMFDRFGIFLDSIVVKLSFGEFSVVFCFVFSTEGHVTMDSEGEFSLTRLPIQFGSLHYVLLVGFRLNI